MAQIVRRSIITGKEHQVNIPHYESDDFELRWLKYSKGLVTLREAFPLCNEHELTFIDHGILPSEREDVNYIV